MENKITNYNQNNQAKHFAVKEGSNYKVIMTYDRQEVISYEHFVSLSKKIFTSDAVFTTVNNIIVQVKDIRIIEPTKELTYDQKQASYAEAIRSKEEDEEFEQLEEIRNNFTINFYSVKLGKNWDAKEVFKNKEVMQEATEAFKLAMPETYERISILSKKLKSNYEN